MPPEKVIPKIAVSMIVILFLLMVGPSSFAATYYVLAGGTGNFSGTDWANANCKIPSSLAAGDVVYIGNSGGNLADTTTPCAGEARHTFSQSGTWGSHITIKFSTVADHGTDTGWQASYATPPATWSNNISPSETLIPEFWQFCGSYYDVKGQVGTTDQTGTYGFYFKSPARMVLITMLTRNCTPYGPTITNLAFDHIEVDGVEANSTENGAHAGGVGIGFGNNLDSVIVDGPFSFDHTYVHDIFGPFSGNGMTQGLTISNSYIYTNFSDAAQHSNGLDTQNPSGGFGINNLDVHDSVWKNIQGTGVITMLGSANSDSHTIYNNLFYYSSDWDAICEHGDTTATCSVGRIWGDNGTGGSSTVTNSVFYGNTIANMHIKPGHSGAVEFGVAVYHPGSTGNFAKNNLWYNCQNANIFADNTPGSYQYLNVTHDYNTFVNTDYYSGETTLSAHDYQESTYELQGQPNPFVGASDFRLSSETVVPHLNDGVSLAAPFNLDFAGNTRGADGTWERGAFEFNGGVAAKQDAPTNLRVTGIQ